MSEEIKVGDTLWRFDSNHRQYDKPGPGGRIVYRSHFVPEVITGETKMSWLVQWYQRVVWKINKKTLATAMQNGYSGSQFYTAQGVEDDIWRNEHRCKIEGMMRGASIDQLRQIGAILGYDDAAESKIT